MGSMEPAVQGIFSLPNEILLSIFSLFPTKELATFAPTCHRLHSLVLRILQNQLQIAAGLDGHTLYLECGPPAAKWTTSKVFCSPLGTDGLQELVQEVQQHGGSVGHMGRMGNLYSRFRPTNQEPDFRSVPRPHPAGDVPGSRTYLTAEEQTAAWQTYARDAVTRDLNIDASFLFSQLETVAYLGRRERTRGVLYSIQEVCDGTIRVWRDWLAKQCEKKSWTDGETIAVQHESCGVQSSTSVGGADGVSDSQDPRKDPGVLWLTTPGNPVGIKFRVKEKKWRRDNPVIFESEVDLPVSYSVELQEVLVRTTHLLLRLEESRGQVLNETGKAMVFGTYLE